MTKKKRMGELSTIRRVIRETGKLIEVIVDCEIENVTSQKVRTLLDGLNLAYMAAISSARELGDVTVYEQYPFLGPLGTYQRGGEISTISSNSSTAVVK